MEFREKPQLLPYHFKNKLPTGSKPPDNILL